MIDYNPYIRSRFIVDAIVRKLAENTNIKIYTEKLNSLKPPFLFVSTQNIAFSKKTNWLNFKDYLMLVYGRFSESSVQYADLDELGCLLTDILEIIYLPLGHSLKMGEQPVGEVFPLRGTNMNNHISIESGYAEMYFYVRYRIQVFRENPIEPIMKEERIKFKRKEE